MMPPVLLYLAFLVCWMSVFEKWPVRMAACLALAINFINAIGFLNKML